MDREKLKDVLNQFVDIMAEGDLAEIRSEMANESEKTATIVCQLRTHTDKANKYMINHR